MADRNRFQVHAKADDLDWQRDHVGGGSLKHGNDTADDEGKTLADASSKRIADLSEDIEYPLVDAALAASRKTRQSNGYAEYGPQVIDLESEAGRLVNSASLLAHGSMQIAMGGVTNRKTEIRKRIRERPLFALGFVATVAYILGATR